MVRCTPASWRPVNSPAILSSPGELEEGHVAYYATEIKAHWHKELDGENAVLVHR